MALQLLRLILLLVLHVLGSIISLSASAYAAECRENKTVKVFVAMEGFKAASSHKFYDDTPEIGKVKRVSKEKDCRIARKRAKEP